MAASDRRKKAGGSLAMLRAQLELARSRLLAIKARKSSDPLLGALLLATSNQALLQSKRIAGLPEGLPEQPTVALSVNVSLPVGWTLEEESDGSCTLRSSDGGGPGQSGPEVHVDVLHIALSNEGKGPVRRKEERD